MEEGRGRVDLHIHSTASDGVLTPSEVVRLALERGLAAMALTDHDSLSGIGEAQQAAAGTPLEVIAGVEISCEGEWGELHVLGFYVDEANGRLRSQLEEMRAGRLQRAQGMVKRLQEMGLDIDWAEVQALAGGESVGRPHVARALLNHGHVGSMEEAFAIYLGRDGPAYVTRTRVMPCEAVATITAAGGVPVLAHPACSGEQAMSRVEYLAHCGLRGLEVYYPHHGPSDVKRLLKLCKRHGLLATGGSDFHSPNGGEGAPVGSVDVPFECVERLREAAGR